MRAWSFLLVLPLLGACRSKESAPTASSDAQAPVGSAASASTPGAGSSPSVAVSVAASAAPEAPKGPFSAKVPALPRGKKSDTKPATQYLTEESEPGLRALAIRRGAPLLSPNQEPPTQAVDRDAPVELTVVEEHPDHLRVLFANGLLKVVAYVPRAWLLPVPTAVTVLGDEGPDTGRRKATVTVAPGTPLRFVEQKADRWTAQYRGDEFSVSTSIAVPALGHTFKRAPLTPVVGRSQIAPGTILLDAPGGAPLARLTGAGTFVGARRSGDPEAGFVRVRLGTAEVTVAAWAPESSISPNVLDSSRGELGSAAAITAASASAATRPLTTLARGTRLYDKPKGGKPVGVTRSMLTVPSVEAESGHAVEVSFNGWDPMVAYVSEKAAKRSPALERYRLEAAGVKLTAVPAPAEPMAIMALLRVLAAECVVEARAKEEQLKGPYSIELDWGDAGSVAKVKTPKAPPTLGRCLRENLAAMRLGATPTAPTALSLELP